MPLTSDAGWAVDYSNITKPTLFIETGFTVVENDMVAYRNNTLNGRKQALDAVRAKGIDPSQFAIVYTPSDINQ